MLKITPTVIPDVTDFAPITDDLEEEDDDDKKRYKEEGSQKSISMGSSEIPGDNQEGNGASSRITNTWDLITSFNNKF